MDDVARDDRLVGVLEDPFEVAGVGLRAEELVDFLRGRLLADLNGEVDDRAGRDGRAHRHPVDLALELGEDDADRAGRSGRGRDEVERGGAGAAKIGVRAVLEHLILRVRVDRRHEAALDPVRLVEDLRHRRDAVRRARRVRDDVVLLRVVLAVVDAEHDGEVGVGRGRGDDDLARAGLEVLLGALALREEAGRLDDDVDAEVAPWQIRRIALGEKLDLVTADGDRAVAELDGDAEVPEHRVVLEEMGHRLRVAEVVRRDDLEVAAAVEVRAREVAADAAEAVDPDLDLRHRLDPLCSSRIRASRASLTGLPRAKIRTFPHDWRG